MASIVTLTMNPTIDECVSVDRLVPEHKLRCEAPRFDAGGGGLNVSRALRELGGSSLAVYAGGGPPGVILSELLDAAGVDHQAVAICGWTRTNITVLEQATHHQFRFVMPGPTLLETEWRACLEALESLDPPPSHLVASGSLPPGVPEDFYLRVARLSRSRGSRFIVDTSGGPLRQALTEGGVYLAKPNLRELGQIAQAPVADGNARVAASRDLVESGRCEVVVVSLSEEGALLVTREGAWHLTAPPVPLGSRVGAGDSMVAGIVLGLARGDPIATAARQGVAAGTAAVITPGTELCRRSDFEALLPQIAVRAI